MEMRAWVGCLACYNEGRLTGEWVDAIDAAEYVPCDRPDHEEYWCFDHELPVTGEVSPANAAAVAEAIESVDEDSREAFVAYVDSVAAVTAETLADHVDDFEDAYSGQWDNELDYTYQLVDELDMLKADDTRAQYFDYEKFNRDLFMTDYFSVPIPNGGGVYVFRNV